MTLKSDVVAPYSAGVTPKGVDPRAVKAMAEVGIDISGYKSKDMDTVAGVEFDHVITLCDRANDSCPVFMGKTRRHHMGFDDPPQLAANAASEEEKMDHYRRVRDEIRVFVEGMPGNL